MGQKILQSNGIGTAIPQVDVLICGGGPVGLLLSYQLARMGISTYTIEQYDKGTQGLYGRACILYPRTIEMLDQLDLNDALSQTGFIGRGSVAFNDGNRVYGGPWDFISKVHDTYFDYCLNIRQKYSENVIREALEQYERSVHNNVILKSFSVGDEKSEYKITTDLEHEGGKTAKIQSKYIIGADGGHSTVRTISKIPFLGEKTALHWIRIDAVVKTNMPDARVGFGAIESPTHGNVLWTAIDHGRTRIGFALLPAIYEKYGEDIKEEDVKKEAIQAVAPFELEFVTVDWWTLYAIARRVADTFRTDQRVLLAGDAGHTHSSGTAQGMNTGVHDAVNLGWKLAGVLNGWFEDSVLETYSEERRPVAQQLLALDKTMSTLINGNIPDGYDSSGNPHEILHELLDHTAQFTMGLGVHYEDNTINKGSSISSIKSGWRGPDVLVHKPGSKIPTRLYSVTKNHGKFWILVFAGAPFQTVSKLKALRGYLDGPKSFTKHLTNAFNFATIIAGTGLQPDEVLGVNRFGEAFYDPDHSAHVRYGIAAEYGGLVVLRPDGILGFDAGLNEGDKVAEYLEAFVTKRQ